MILVRFSKALESESEGQTTATFADGDRRTTGLFRVVPEMKGSLDVRNFDLLQMHALVPGLWRAHACQLRLQSAPAGCMQQRKFSSPVTYLRSIGFWLAASTRRGKTPAWRSICLE